MGRATGPLPSLLDLWPAKGMPLFHHPVLVNSIKQDTVTDSEAIILPAATRCEKSNPVGRDMYLSVHEILQWSAKLFDGTALP